MKRVDEFEVLVSECGDYIYNDGLSVRYGYRYKIQTTDTGYKQIGRTVNGKRRTLQVHRLVAMAYIPNPENKPEVNHKDGNKANNHVSNLEWCTRKENQRHAYDSGFMVANGPPKKTERDALIKTRFANGETIKALAEEYEVTEQRIKQIVNNVNTMKNYIPMKERRANCTR